MKIIMRKLILLVLLPMGLWGQVTIVSDGLNNSTSLFTLSNGAYFTGNSASGDRPATSPFAIEGSHSRGVSSASATLTSSSINTSGYTSIEMTFRLASFSITSTGNGADAGDIVTVEVSPNGGTNWYSTSRVLGNSNAYWAYSTGTGNASTAYDGNTTPVDFQPSAGGNRTTDGYGTVTITSLPAANNLQIRITILNDNANERWLIDDFKIVGIACPAPSSPSISSITSSSASLSWTAASSAPSSGYEYFVTTSSTLPNSSTTPTGTGISGTSASLTGLNPLTTYYSYVRSNCGSGILGTWIAASSFVTTSAGTITGATTTAAFTSTYGTASTSQSFSISGTGLIANLVATAPSGYEVSPDNTTWGATATYTQTSGSASGTLYIRLLATAVPGGSYNSSNIILTSTGTTSANITTPSSGNTVSTKALTISSAAAQNKVFNNTNIAVITGTLTGVNGSDIVTLNPSGTFATVNVGTAIAVTSTSTLGGAQASYYTLTQPTGLSADITIASQSITFTLTSPITTSTSTISLTGTASSGLAISYTSSNTAVATVTGSTLNILGVGSTVITASQSGNSNYSPATDVLQTLVVSIPPVLYTFDGGSGTSAPTNATGLANLSFGNLSQGNNNGTTTLINNGSSSSGYSGSSGNYNAGAAARVGGYSSSTSAYFEFTITPSTGYGVEVTSLSLGARSTGTGPTTIDIRSSLDGYASSLGTISYAANSAWIFNSTSLSLTSNLRSPLTIRLYGHSGTGSPAINTANWRIDDISVFARAIGTCPNTIASSSLTGLTEQCLDSAGWTYYGNSTNRYFAIKKNGNAINATVDITVNAGSAAYTSTSSNGSNQEHGSYLLGRYWNVSCTGCTYSLGGGVDVRFFYDPSEITNARSSRNSAFSALKTANPSTLADTTASLEWFKTNSVVFAPNNFTGNKLTVAHTKLTGTLGTLNSVNYVEFTGISSFSGGGGGFGFGPPSGGGGVGLPVTWAGLDALVNADHTELLWQTASEQNTSHFEVEASEDGKNFKTMSENIAAAGNSASLLSYSFRDMDLAPIKYYRLKQVDIEGTFEYSKIIVAKRSEGEKQGFDITVYPVSETNNRQYHLLLKNKIEDISAIQIVDYTGKPVFHMTSSKNTELLDLNFLTHGIYMIQVWNGEEKQVERVVVQ